MLLATRGKVFTLKTLDDKPVELRRLVTNRPVVLVVLRGWPGYQCPICTRQVHDFATDAAEFSAARVQVSRAFVFKRIFFAR